MEDVPNFTDSDPLQSFLFLLPNPSTTSGSDPSSAALHTEATTLDLEKLLGPRRQDLIRVIPVTIIYAVIFVTGLVGNVSTCIVIARNQYMHTTTNYCLFNLAVSDLLMLLLGLPQETYTFWSAYPWIFSETFCVLRTLAAETSTYASILTITAFTVERYVAICHPVKARASNTGLQRAVKLVVLIWILSTLCSIPIVIQYGVVYVKDSSGRDIPDSATCNIRQDRYLPHAFEASTFLFFIAPVTIIGILYGLIGLAIRRSALLTRVGSDTSTRSAPAAVQDRISCGGLGSGSGEQQKCQQLQARARLAVIKMLVAVVVAFFICWAPFHTQRLLSIYWSGSQDSQHGRALHAFLFYFSGVFYYVSAVINPILYNIMSLKFRRAFRTTLCRASAYWTCLLCCCTYCCRDSSRYGSAVQTTTKLGLPRAPARGATAYRFSGRGHVQMIQVAVDGRDGGADDELVDNAAAGSGRHGRASERNGRPASVSGASLQPGNGLSCGAARSCCSCGGRCSSSGAGGRDLQASRAAGAGGGGGSAGIRQSRYFVVGSSDCAVGANGTWLVDAGPNFGAGAPCKAVSFPRYLHRCDGQQCSGSGSSGGSGGGCAGCSHLVNEYSRSAEWRNNGTRGSAAALNHCTNDPRVTGSRLNRPQSSKWIAPAFLPDRTTI